MAWDDPLTGFPKSSEADLGPYNLATEEDHSILDAAFGGDDLPTETDTTEERNNA